MQRYASPHFDAARIYNNTALNNGGGVYVTGTSAPQFSNSDLLNNSATQFGGGAAVTGSEGAIATFHNNTIRGNDAKAGGGIYISSAAPRMKGGRIEGNNASMRAGGIYIVEVNPCEPPP